MPIKAAKDKGSYRW